MQATRGSRHYFNDWLGEHSLNCSQLFKSKFEAQSLACSVVNTSLFQQKVTVFFFRFILRVCLYVCVCVYVWGGVQKCTHTYTQRGKKGALDSLELEVEAAVGHQVCALTLWSSKRTARALTS